MNKLVADEGMVFDYKEPIDNQHIFAKLIYLGIGDSADNYIQVEESVRDEWERQQEQEEKEAELHRLLRELYPDNKEE